MGAEFVPKEPGGLLRSKRFKRLRFETGILRQPKPKPVLTEEEKNKPPTKKKINRYYPKYRDEAKMTYLEDIVAFIYSRLDEALIPKEKLIHQRVFQLRHRIEKGKCSPRSFRKRRAACYHRACWITSPLAVEEDSNIPEEEGVEVNTRKETRSPLPSPPLEYCKELFQEITFVNNYTLISSH